jgi:hypothetical protein
MSMKKPSNNLSALFRSLGPDEAGLEAIAKGAAPKVEKEWPLFKAVPPVEQQPTPPLSKQERKVWSKQEKVKVEVPRPTLSMSGLSSKLAKSLSQISEQMAVDESDTVTRTPEKRSLGALNQGRQEKFPERVPSSDSPMIAKSSTVVKPFEREEKSIDTGLSESASPQPVLAQEKTKSKTYTKAKDTVKYDDRLANIFSRLDEKEQATPKPVEKRSSLLNRIGKR